MKSVRLSPVDHVFTGPGAYPIEFLFRYNVHLDPGRLQAGLERMVPLFWPVAGRLRARSGDSKLARQSYDLVWEGEMPELQVTDRRSVPFPNLSSPDSVLPLRVNVESAPGRALFGFHLYQFREGSALVVNISHCVVDGYSYFYFISSWAQRCRRLTLRDLLFYLLGRPDHRRSKLVPTTELNGDYLFDGDECFKKLGISLATGGRNQDRTECNWEFFEFSFEEVEAALARANSSLTIHKSDMPARLSVNDILSALILKRLADTENFFGDRARVAMAFDYRRVLPQLNSKYFGNAVRAAAFELPTAEIRGMETDILARQFRACTHSINVENSIESLKYLEKARIEQGLSYVQSLQVADDQCGLLITNLSRVPPALMDFGDGAPIQSVALTPAPRTAVITRQSQGYSVRVSLPSVG
ncbi:MAG: acyltransferase [Bdellovibrionales bacterium]